MKCVQVFWIVCVVGIIYAEYLESFSISLNNVWRAIKDALRQPLRARARKKNALRSKSTEASTTSMDWFFETKPDNPDLLVSTGKPVTIPIFTSPRTRGTKDEMEIKEESYKK